MDSARIGERGLRGDMGEGVDRRIERVDPSQRGGDEFARTHLTAPNGFREFQRAVCEREGHSRLLDARYGPSM